MRSTLHIVLLCFAVLAAALFADAWRSASHDSQRLSATLAAQKSQLQAAAGREQQRDAQLAAALASIRAQTRAVRTPRQAAEEIPSILPPLPLPVAVHFPELSAPLSPTTEPPPAAISVPQRDLLPLYTELQNCRAAGLEADAAQKDLADEKARSASLLRERDAAIAAARGGKFLTHLKRAAKWFAIGVVAGAAAAAAARR